MSLYSFYLARIASSGCCRGFSFRATAFSFADRSPDGWRTQLFGVVRFAMFPAFCPGCRARVFAYLLRVSFPDALRGACMRGCLWPLRPSSAFYSRRPLRDLSGLLPCGRGGLERPGSRRRGFAVVPGCPAYINKLLTAFVHIA